MRHSSIIMMLLVSLSFSLHAVQDSYLALGSYFGASFADLLEFDSAGNIAIKKTVSASHDSEQVLISPKGNLALLGGYTQFVGYFGIDKHGTLTHLGDIVTTHPNVALAMTPDTQYLILSNDDWEKQGAYFVSYKIIRDKQIVATGFSHPDGRAYMWISKWQNTMLVPVYLDVYRIGPHGEISFTGSSLLVPAYLGSDLSPDGHLFIALAAGEIWTVWIEENGEVTGPVQKVEGSSLGPREVAFTPDGRLALFTYSISPFDVYRVEDDGYLTHTGYSLEELDFCNELAITPDGNFALVQWPAGGSPVYLYWLRIHHDGSVEIINVTPWTYYLSDVKFIPPQVLCEFGIGEEWEDFANWEEKGDTQYDLPEFVRLSSGTLAICPKTNNTFGFWQSPLDAAMTVPYSLYRVRAEVKRSKNQPPATSAQIPTLRLRCNAQTFQQGDTVVVQSVGSCDFVPQEETWNRYEMFFVPPISSCSRPEEQDDVFFSLDTYIIESDDVPTSFELTQLFIDRIPVDCISTVTLLKEYSFESSQEGWTPGTGITKYDAPTYSWETGALLMQSTSTNCFGAWDSPIEVEMSPTSETYRVTFEITTDEQLREKVPDLRFRLSTQDFSYNVEHVISSVGDAEMGPVYDPAKPDKTFEYTVYFHKPVSTNTHKLRLSLDLINLTPDNSPTATLKLHHARIEKIQLPRFPEDAYL